MMSSFSLIKRIAIANLARPIPVDIPLILTFERVSAVKNPISFLASLPGGLY